MCKLGDIIVVNKYLSEDGTEINKHSFVVINDKEDFIEGFRYDLVTNVMSSFKSEEHRTKKLRFEENLEIVSDMVESNLPKNDKSGFIKADQLIYFDKSKLDYYIFGKIDDELLDELMMLIVSLNNKGKIKNNIENIKNGNNKNSDEPV